MFAHAEIKVEISLVVDGETLHFLFVDVNVSKVNGDGLLIRYQSLLQHH